MQFYCDFSWSQISDNLLPAIELSECLHDSHPPGLILATGHEHRGEAPGVEVVWGGLGNGGVVGEHQHLGVGHTRQNVEQGGLDIKHIIRGFKQSCVLS